MRGILELRQRRGEITGEKRCQSRRFCLCQRVSSNLPHTPTVAGAELTQSQFLPLNSTGQCPVSLFLSCLSYSPCLCFPRLSLSLFTWTPIKMRTPARSHERLDGQIYWTEERNHCLQLPSRTFLLILWNHSVGQHFTIIPEMDLYQSGGKKHVQLASTRVSVMTCDQGQPISHSNDLGHSTQARTGHQREWRGLTFTAGENPTFPDFLAATK